MDRIVLFESGQYSWSVWLEGKPEIKANGHYPKHALKEMKKALKSAGLPDTIKGNYEIVYLPPDDL